MAEEIVNDLDFFYYWLPLSQEEFGALKEGDEIYIQTSSGLREAIFWGFRFQSNSGEPRYSVLVEKQGRIVSSREVGRLGAKTFLSLTEPEYLALERVDNVVFWGTADLGRIPSRRTEVNSCALRSRRGVKRLQVVRKRCAKSGSICHPPS